jgi:DNA-binding response OmpR family regulator
MAKILLVHDTPEQLRDIRKAALRAGYTGTEIVEAADERSAYEAIDNNQFDVAIIDISLTPGELTHEGLGIIKTLRERQIRCRILGLTSKLHELGADVLDEGADDFIYTEWASINYLELLRNKLAIWRKARPRAALLV